MKSIRQRRPVLLATVAALALTVLAPISVSASHSDQSPPETEPSATLNLLGQFEVNVPGLTSDVWALGNYARIWAASANLSAHKT